jgi:predicted ArsR family transcriptional regulator
MADESIPDDVRDFILRNIDSIAQLEALLLLRAQPGGWTTDRVAQRLYTNEQDIFEVLTRLAADGFLSVQNHVYRFECATPEQQAMVDRTADVYRRQLIAMTNMIHAKPRRIRQFADAFKFKKDR